MAASGAGYCGNDLYVMYPVVKMWMDRTEALPLVKEDSEDQERALKEEKT